MRFNRLDLNLLVALDALLGEQSITRAAERLHLSQSAMSGALGRLREHFQDELLVQVGRRMMRTALAETLVTPVREILLLVQATVDRQPAFEPTQSDRKFTLMVSDYVLTILMTEVVRRVGVLAPGIMFEFLPQDETVIESLDRGEVDFIVQPKDYVTNDHPYAPLFDETYACVVSKDNPAVGETLTCDEYLRMGHVIVRFGRNRMPAFDEWFLTRFGFARRVEVVATSFNAVPHFIVGTRHIATMHRRLAAFHEEYLPIRLLPPPIEIPPLTEILQWHKIQDRDPAIMWMREVICATARELFPSK